MRLYVYASQKVFCIYNMPYIITSATLRLYIYLLRYNNLPLVCLFDYIYTFVMIFYVITKPY